MNKEYTPGQIARLKRNNIIFDIILILVILVLGIYIYTNVHLIKGVVSGDLHPCYICETEIGGASCTENGESVYWNARQIPNTNTNFSGYNISLS